MNIAVVGAGFVGQATGRGFAKHKKNKVTFVDIDEDKIASLRKEGFEAFTPQQYPSITTDVTMFAVPTPTKFDKIETQYIELAVKEFAQRLKQHNKYHTVVVRSTVTPGTTRQTLLPIIEEFSGKKVGKDFGLVMQPEYLREVTANEDFERPWLILYGANDDKAAQTIEKLYKLFDAPIVRVKTIEEAEIQKYIHNVFNAVKIAFFNEIRVAIKKEGWDADDIFLNTAQSCEGIWNPLYGLRDYGPFDGACLPKDTRALLYWGESKGYDFGILKAVINQNMKHQELLGKNTKVAKSYLTTKKVEVKQPA